MRLNLGCGDRPIPGTIGVDALDKPGCMKYNLKDYPWPWDDESVDGIHAYHILEHVFDWEKFIRECLRILKPGGYLHLKVPHASCIPSAGLLTHYRTFSYHGLEFILTKPNEVFPIPPFKTDFIKITWFTFPYGRKTFPLVLWIAIPLNKVISFLINLGPMLFEHLWCYWVGGAREVEWKGRKI